MSSVVINGDTSGSITLAAPAVSGTNTITMPATTGTMMVNGPAFSVYRSAAYTIAASTTTKITFDATDFDTASNYSTSTGRFTPTVAGYYQLNAVINHSSTADQYLGIYKNGSIYKWGQNTNGSSGSDISSLVYANGSTDYFEIYIYNFTGATKTGATGSTNTWFNGVMVRGA